MPHFASEIDDEKAENEQFSATLPSENCHTQLLFEECVVEPLRHALNVLAVVAPDWGLRQVQPDWLERYGPRESRISLPLWDRRTKASPGSGGQRWMEAVGGD